MNRTLESIEFEERWKQIRTTDELVPLKSDLSPKLFRNFLVSMALAEVDIINNTAIVRLAGTKIRDYVGFETTGTDFNSLSSTGLSDM